MFMDSETYDTDDESTYSYTNVRNESILWEQAKVKESDLVDQKLTLVCQTQKTDDPFGVRSRLGSSKRQENEHIAAEANCAQCKDSNERLYHVNYV